MRSTMSDQQTLQAPATAGQRRTTAPQVEVTIRQTAEEVIVHIKGEATFASASSLDAGLLPVTAQRPRLVTLDLSELSCLSALAMGVLVGFRRAVVRAGGRVQLTLPSQVRETFGGAELLELFAAN